MDQSNASFNSSEQTSVTLTAILPTGEKVTVEGSGNFENIPNLSLIWFRRRNRWRKWKYFATVN